MTIEIDFVKKIVKSVKIVKKKRLEYVFNVNISLAKRFKVLKTNKT